MRQLSKNSINKRIGSEGASLAIALFFFLLCSLICAGVIYLANSSISNASKSLENVQDTYPLKPENIPVPTSADPTPAIDPIDPEIAADVEAINAVYGILERDLGNAFITAGNGGETKIYKAPTNVTYEILSYIHFYYNRPSSASYYDPDLVENAADNGSVSKTFQVTLNDLPTVNVTVKLTGTNGSKFDGNLNAKTGLEFKTISITVESVNHPECDKKIYNYSVDGEGKCYIRSYYVNGKPSETYFVIKSTP